MIFPQKYALLCSLERTKLNVRRISQRFPSLDYSFEKLRTFSKSTDSFAVVSFFLENKTKSKILQMNCLLHFYSAMAQLFANFFLMTFSIVFFDRIRSHEDFVKALNEILAVTPPQYLSNVFLF